METAVVRQFLDFFQDYINLCQANAWPSSDVSVEEIENAFIISKHIEKCLDRLHRKSLLNEFMNTVNKEQNTSSLFLKNCFTDPPKYILKKIIQSKISIQKLDEAFRLFIDLFSEGKLELVLADIMLEKASCEILLNNIHIEIPKHKIMKFKSDLLLLELSCCGNMDKFIQDMLKHCDQNTMDVLVMCLLCKDMKFNSVVQSCVNVFIQTMLSKDVSNKKFWKFLFHINDQNFIGMCLNHCDMYKTIIKALIDCARLLQENMCTEFFYIDLTYSDLVSVVNKIALNDNLKLEFLDILYTSNTNLEFWNNIMKL